MKVEFAFALEQRVRDRLTLTEGRIVSACRCGDGTNMYSVAFSANGAPVELWVYENRLEAVK